MKEIDNAKMHTVFDCALKNIFTFCVSKISRC
jgi:hypothetical protein